MHTWSANARDGLHFEVVFTFPAAPPERSPLHIHEFTTQTSNFAHEIGDLWRSLLFENMQLDASNSRIRVDVSTFHGPPTPTRSSFASIRLVHHADEGVVDLE